MRTSTDRLPGILAKGLAPVWLVSGDEPLQSGEACDAIRAAARARGFIERETHFVDRYTAWADIGMSAQAMSLFSTGRVLELRMPRGNPGTSGEATLVRLAESAGQDLLLLVITGKLDGKARGSAWVRRFEELGVHVTADPVPPEQFAAWLTRRAQSLGLTLEPDAANLLATLTEGNLLAADQELRKLLLSGRESANADAVLESVSASSRFDVNRLTEVALAGEGREALRVLAGLRAEGTEPALVLWAILREMRTLWTQLHPGAPLRQFWTTSPQQAERAARRLRGTRGAFARLAERASRADRMIKGRLQGNAWDELALLATELAGVRTLSLPRTPGQT